MSGNYRNLISEAESQVRQFLAPLMTHFDDPMVNEIMINSYDRIFVEKLGSTKQLDLTLNDRTISGAIQAIATLNAKEATPLIDARLKGIRVAAVLPPVAVHGPLLAIRKLVTEPDSFDSYLDRGDFTQQAGRRSVWEDAGERHSMELAAAQGGKGLVEFFQWLMTKREDVAVVGGTSSGKTRLGGAFLRSIPNEHRIVTCEDTNELVLLQPNVVQLEGNTHLGITLRHLIKMCLRLRPDRIIVGEVRGPEFYDLLDAANTGHPGTLFTLHANSARLALTRMESFLRMSPDLSDVNTTELRRMIVQSLKYVVFQARDGKARVPEEVIAIEPELTQGGDYITRTVYMRYPN